MGQSRAPLATISDWHANAPGIAMRLACQCAWYLEALQCALHIMHVATDCVEQFALKMKRHLAIECAG